MDRSFKIGITFEFSDFVVRSLLSAGGPYHIYQNGDEVWNKFLQHYRNDP